MAKKPTIVVVGAGIIGASIAYHLARAGAGVTVIDAGETGGLATRNSWAWINASWGNPEPYYRLRVRSMEEWRRLEREVPGIAVAWGGGLIWDLPREELERFAEQHAAWGYGIERVDRATAQRIEPQLASHPEFALHVPGEGAVEPLSATQALLKAAGDLGARIIARRSVLSLTRRGARVTGVAADGGPIAADRVVVAAGAQTGALVATAGAILPLGAPAGLLVVTKPRARLLNGLVMAPEMHLRQTADGRIIAGDDFGGGDPGADPEAAAWRLFDALKGMLRSGETLVFDHYKLGYRPMPEDGFPAVGGVGGIDGLYLAVMHSAITLAPAVGRFAAEELLNGRRDPLLTPYSPERFGKISR